jgi:hypothetical protein
VPDAVVLHDESSATSAAWGDERTERWMDATYAWLRDTEGPARARAIAALNVAGAAARAAARPRRREFYATWARRHARAGLRAPNVPQPPS